VAAPPQTLPSVEHTVSQAQIVRYAEASGDHNPLHLDQAFAAGTSYGGTIAHGMLVMAFLSEMLTKAFGTGWIAGSKLKVRFRAPVYPDDTITTEGSLREGGDESGEAAYNVACRNQSQEPVITGEARLRWPPD
jgi:3-hydroxybutyryl-CoA dehydratase